MGCNYYARIKPSKERREELKKILESDDFKKIVDEVHKTYGKFNVEFGEVSGGFVHLGKSSGGWKFLWNPNVYVIKNGHMESSKDEKGVEHRIYVPDPDTAFYLYPLNKKGIKDFINRKDVAIYDEEHRYIDKEEFWEMTQSKDKWQGKEAWDAATYEKEYPNERRWQCKSDLINLLEKEGYEFTSWSRSDFCSDGLRFATCTDFS